MHNSIAKNQKNISGSFERKPQIYEIWKLWKTKKCFMNFQGNDNFQPVKKNKH